MIPLPVTEKQLAAMIDQTNLRPQATRQEMTAFLHQVRQNGFATAAILPQWAPLASEILAESGVAVDPAVGFPLGTTTTAQKVAETRWCVRNSGPLAEIDMVMNLVWFKSGRYPEVTSDIRAVVEAAEGQPVKVIIEVPLLTRREIEVASLLVAEAGAHYVKTSTGFRALRGWRPCTADDVRLIRSAVGDRVKIKIAGGVTCIELALAAIEAGADRIGTIFGMDILKGYRRFLECC
jgi:deoxyribose-phosphate aldolase